MKLAAYFFFFTLAIGLAGCGYSAPTNSQGQSVSGLKNRAFVANASQTITGFGGGVEIVDAQHDQLTAFTIGGLSGIAPQSLFVVPGQVGATFSTSDNKLYLFNPINESSIGSVGFPGRIGNFVLSPDFKFAYAAVPQTGQVITADLTGFTLFPSVNVFEAHSVSLSPDGTNLMIVTDNSTVSVMTTNNRTVTNITGTAGVIDHPVASFFIDNTHAAVLSCGAECGGAQANVAIVSLATDSVTSHTNIDAGTVGLFLDGTLFVAGNCTAGCQASLGGELTVLNVTTSAATVQYASHIGGGFHQLIVPSQNSELFIGAVGEPSPGDCSNPASVPGPSGCLTIFNLPARASTIDSPKGDVTGATPIPNRNIVYVIEGGQLLVYDITTNQQYTVTKNIPIPGFITDVKAGDH